MDPKHQFAAQYMLSRAAAERRERESLLAVANAVAANAAAAAAAAASPSSTAGPSPSAHHQGSLRRELYDGTRLRRNNVTTSVHAGGARSTS
jgi:hypothetical protein